MLTRSSLIAGVSIAFLLGCGGSECKEETVQYTKSLNAVGFGGATQGVTVARFDLTQDFVSHTPYEACAQGPLQDVGTVTLKITSLVAQPILLRYDVQGLNTSGLLVWNHPDTLGVTLAPGQTIDVGQVTTTPVKLGEGGARVLLQTALYVP